MRRLTGCAVSLELYRMKEDELDPLIERLQEFFICHLSLLHRSPNPCGSRTRFARQYSMARSSDPESVYKFFGGIAGDL
jgi:hypothetical protein